MQTNFFFILYLGIKTFYYAQFIDHLVCDKSPRMIISILLFLYPMPDAQV